MARWLWGFHQLSFHTLYHLQYQVDSEVWFPLTILTVCRIREELGLPEGVPFAIGPWHIRPHKPECNVRYNSRYMVGLGLTFGDLIEHL